MCKTKNDILESQKWFEITFWLFSDLILVESFQNHVLTFSISQFSIGLWLTEDPKIILVPMSYIAFLEITPAGIYKSRDHTGGDW